MREGESVSAMGNRANGAMHALVVYAAVHGLDAQRAWRNVARACSGSRSTAGWPTTNSAYGIPLRGRQLSVQHRQWHRGRWGFRSSVRSPPASTAPASVRACIRSSPVTSRCAHRRRAFVVDREREREMHLHLRPRRTADLHRRPADCPDPVLGAPARAVHQPGTARCSLGQATSSTAAATGNSAACHSAVVAGSRSTSSTSAPCTPA